ncbi:hydroxymethylbilane synthase [Zhaonella formicivorans]|uniref:hydroxymethylbilane synthase n=1 Tax=Zhaonella formicivorans TaxID=2528593 RepID=UPI0010DBD8EC|nr:hydroxymethylbilane synthase [Zhaonella formicivorans]
MREIIIGTRESALALWQTNWVLERLNNLNPDCTFRIKKLKTQGDKILDVALAKIGDKGLFTKELEVAMLNGEIDLAVHSMKDLPTQLPAGLMIGAICQRTDPRDVVLSHLGYTLATLPPGAKVGTSSLRRKSQLLHYRPDLQIVDLRGNLNTRVAKLQQEGFAAIILAAAGVERMGYEQLVTEYISPDISLPAVGQGSIGIEIRSEDEEILHVVRKIADPESTAAITAERSFLRTLEGGCQIPIGALGKVEGGKLHLAGLVAGLDGRLVIKDSVTGEISAAEDIGKMLADKLLKLGAKQILNQVRQEIENSDS